MVKVGGEEVEVDSNVVFDGVVDVWSLNYGEVVK